MVTFETKCYENDWEFLLRGTLLEKMIERCNYPFSRRTLFINNVSDIGTVAREADKKVAEGIIDNYVIVDEYADKALEFFQIEKESFAGGYYYSIAELVSIYLCTTPYLLHFSSDTILEKNSSDWITKALTLLSEHKEYAVANPIWNHRHDQAKSESMSELPEWYVGYGFSDQCYLIRTDYFKQPVYNEKNEQSERYLKCSGELFEKRVDAYMRNHNLLRITNKEVSYIHHNFPRNPLKRIIRKVSNYIA